MLLVAVCLKTPFKCRLGIPKPVKNVVTGYPLRVTQVLMECQIWLILGQRFLITSGPGIEQPLRLLSDLLLSLVFGLWFKNMSCSLRMTTMTTLSSLLPGQ